MRSDVAIVTSRDSAFSHACCQLSPIEFMFSFSIVNPYDINRVQPLIRWYRRRKNLFQIYEAKKVP